MYFVFLHRIFVPSKLLVVIKAMICMTAYASDPGCILQRKVVSLHEFRAVNLGRCD